MSLITAKTLAEWRDEQLTKWLTLQSNINTNSDSMVYLDATVIAEVLYLLQQDAVTLTNNAFLAYADWDELSNLWADRGIVRKEAVDWTGTGTFGRSAKASVDYTIDAGTIVWTQPDNNGVFVSFITDSEVILYGIIATPGTVASALATTWGTIWDGTFNYTVTAVTGDDIETDESPNEAVVISSWTGTNKVTLSWASVTWAASYIVYLEWIKLATTTSPSYIDTVWSTGSETQTPPSTNETGNTTIDAAVTAWTAGAVGNVWVWTITNLVQTPIGIETVTNAAETSWGSDKETDVVYRARIQEELSTNVWKVTVTGYQQTAEAVDWVATATVVHEAGNPANEISVYITASGDDNIPWAPLLATVTAELNSDENRAVCDEITAKAPSAITVDVTTTITIYDTDLSESEITTLVEDALDVYFASIEIGGTVRVVDISNAIHDITEITDFTLALPTSNDVLDTYEIATAGTIIVNF